VCTVVHPLLYISFSIFSFQFSCLLIAILRNSLLAALVNARVVMQLPEYRVVRFHVKESRLHKGRYVEWLALHQVLAGKLCYIYIYLGPLLNCQCCFKFLGYSYTWKNTLFRRRSSCSWD